MCYRLMSIKIPQREGAGEGVASVVTETGHAVGPFTVPTGNMCDDTGDQCLEGSIQ